MSVRLRRLQAEYERLKVVFANHQRIRVAEVHGRPPDRYVIEYLLKGLVDEDGGVREKDVHRAEISLGPGYPREMPRCVMLSPVFHPNIDHLAICTEDIGSAGQTLDQTIIFIGQMISFQAYNLQSPRNGDAARWAKENSGRLPLEQIDLVPEVLAEEAASERIALAAQAATREPEAGELSTALITTSAPPVIVCNNCGAPNGMLCPLGHAACTNCMTECSNCRTALCMSCPMERCHQCGAISCQDCTFRCPHCGKSNCPAHVDCCQQLRRVAS